jgi:hypothetical protein
VSTDVHLNPNAPTVGVHWAVIVIGVAAATWLVLAMVVLFGSGDPGSDYLLWIAAGFAFLFFALTLGLSRWAGDDPRWTRRPPPPLADFVDDNVAVATGAIPGREAMAQVLTLPITLAIGATIIGLVFLFVR